MKLWDLPDGWEWKTFDEVADVDSNLVDPADHSHLPHIAPNHIESGTGRLLPYKTIAEDGVTSSKHLFKPGHILYSKIRPYLAKAVTVDFEGLCSADMYPVSTSLDAQFLHRWLISSTFTAQASQSQGRTVLPKINKKALGLLKVPVPPPEDQRRIVTRIESLQARSHRAKEALDAIPPLLERFRQSVLAAAFRGDLTADWRRKNPNVEPASVLLERIRAERKRRWIDAEAEHARSKAEAKATAAGQPWTEADDRRALEAGRKRAEKRYKEPEPVDPEGLPELPEGWCWTGIEPLLSVARAGMKTGPFGSLLKKHDHRPSGVPVFGIENVGRMEFQFGSKIHIDADKAEALAGYDACEGDLLISRSGTVGEVCVVPAGVGPARFSTNIIRVSLAESTMLPSLLGHAFTGCPAVLGRIAQLCSGSSRLFLNQTIMKKLAVPLPPRAEQTEILKRLETLLAEVGRTGVRLVEAESQLGMLDASVLGKAFRGEL